MTTEREEVVNNARAALARYATLVAAERDACATLADEMADRYEKNALTGGHGDAMRDTALALRSLASAIRARARMDVSPR